jgi:hypothetical protein
MRIFISAVALAAVISGAGASSAAAQSRPSIGDIMSGVARGAAAAQRPTAPETPQPSGGRQEGAIQGPAAGPVVQTPPSGGRMDHTAPAGASSTVRHGFTPDEITAEMMPGGSINAATVLGGSCAGMVSSAPNYSFTYTAGQPLLYMRVRSQGDTTLVVRNPNGVWGCSDDYSGMNPALRWDSPQSGTYHIWVGTIREPAPATLYITETN